MLYTSLPFLSRIPLRFGLLALLITLAPGCRTKTPPPLSHAPSVQVVETRYSTNAVIFCNAEGLPDFNDSHAGKIFALPYSGGPNMEYGQQTGARAITNATLSSNATRFESLTEIGGKCGRNGTNKGGWGKVSPQLDGVLRVTHAGPGTRLALTVSITPNDLATEPSTTEWLTLTVPRLGLQRKVSRQELTNPVLITLNSVPSGDLEFTLTTATFVQGCFGASENSYPRKNVAVVLRAVVLP